MKLDVTAFRYLTKDHFRILEALELGMKNHDCVPVPVLTRLAKLRHGGMQKLVSHLIRNRLIAYEGSVYEGYKLTYSGYDFLALRTFMQRGTIVGLGRQIGVGKESDIYIATTADGNDVAIKFHRLGRTSFKAVKTKRDYLRSNESVNWFHMSRLSAMKEYSFMKALYNKDFPTPVPHSWNRHAICMSLVSGSCLFQVRKIHNSAEVYNEAMELIVRLAKCGLVHCDFNEFNLMISDNGALTMIDFPQMISTSHKNASELFDRDVNGVVKFFSRLQGGSYTPDRVPVLSDIEAEADRLDVEMQASGYGGFEVARLEELLIEKDFDSDSEANAIEIPPISSEPRRMQEAPEPLSGDFQQRIQKQVRKSLGKKMSSRPKHARNSSKMSVKGKLYHKSALMDG